MNDMSQVKSNELDWNEKMTEATREVFMNAGRKLLAQLTTLQSQLTQAQTRIKEYEKQWTDMDRTIGTALRQLNEVQQLAQAQNETIRMREGLPTLDKPDVDRRIKVLEACHKRWQECGETECAAIYQGAAFELKLFKDQLTQAERRGEEKAREELKSKARDHVAERCDQIAQLQSQLTQSNELASTLKSQWLSMSTQLTQAHKERDEAVAKIIKWGPLVESYELQVKELSAACASKDEALRLAKDVTSNGFLPNPKTQRFDMTHFDVHAVIDKALSTDCGKAFLERMKEAEWLLDHILEHVAFIACDEAFEWQQRRDAWLKGGGK